MAIEMTERRLLRREDTAARNRTEERVSDLEVIHPDSWTPIVAISITPRNQSSLRISVSASVSMKSVKGYGVLRATWSQGGLTHVFDESEGRVNPLGNEEYSRELAVTGLTVGDAVGITLEGQPFGETLVIDRAYLYAEEW